MAALDPTQRASVVQQAQKIAAQQGITPEQALYNYAQQNGIDPAGVDTYMGFSPGTTQNWAVQNGQLAAPQGNYNPGQAAPAPAPTSVQQAQDIATKYGISPEQASYNYAQKNNIRNAGIDSYMGFNPGQTAPAPAAPAPAPAPTPAAPWRPTPASPWRPPAPTPAPTSVQPLDEATKQAVIAEAQNRANRFGISKEQALYNYAVENGIDNASVDTLMGFAQGSTDAWLKQRDAGMATQASTPAVQQAATMPAPQGNSANLGMGGGQQTYQPLAADHRTAVLAEAQRRATASGKSAEQELYDYAHKGGIDNAGIDTLMGFAQGGTDAWLKQTSQQNNQQQQGNLGMGGGYNPQQNPYLRQMGVDVGNQMFDQWSRNTLPSIRSGAMAAGGFGGSRQGVVEANGINDMNRQYGQALTSMYGNDWSQQQGRNLQQQGLNNSYDLGLRSSDLGFSNLDANINQQNFNNNLAGANFGMGVYGMMNGMNQQGINSGTQMQNTPLNYFNQFNGNTNATGGMGGTQTGTQGTTSNGLSQGLGLGLAVGGLLTK